jgi:tetratricopeptide (TPR) repeat protein
MRPRHPQTPWSAQRELANRLDGTVSGGVVVQAHAIRGDVHISPGARTSASPAHQLPPAPAHFAGRRAELEHLTASPPVRRGTTRVVLINGPAGVGKTALALTWLHHIRDGYPDGQLFGDLQGYAPRPPASPRQILANFLRALGVEPSSLPTELAELAALFRSVTTDRRVIVMVDNAARVEDVLPFMPGPPRSVLAVTSRRRMAGLVARGADAITLGSLSEQSALDLVGSLIGADRLRRERASATDLVRACDGLPLALRLAGAQLASRPHYSIRRIVEDLAHAPGILDVLAADDLSVRDALDLSCRSLPTVVADALSLVASHPGPDFSTAVLSAAADTTMGVADHVLNQLVDVHLVEELAADRYRFHDLVRTYLLNAAQARFGPKPLAASAVRVRDWYLAAVRAADRTAMPTRRRLDDAPRDEAAAPRFAGAAESLDWLEAHLPHLMDLLRRSSTPTDNRFRYRMVDAMWSFFLHRKHYPEWLEANELALRAARADRNVLAETLTLNHLGLGLFGLARFDEAEHRFRTALELHRTTGDTVGEASAWNGLGLVCDATNRHAEAVTHLTRAFHLQAALGQRRGEALTRVNLARTTAALGRRVEAESHARKACAMFEELADPYNAARARIELAALHIVSGTADPLLHDALKTMTALGADKELARVRDLLARSALRSGDIRAAREHRGAARHHRALVGQPSTSR